MEQNILKYIWKHSRKQQLWMLVIILASMPTYFFSLELPKNIVNGPIQGGGFENPGDHVTFLQIWLPFSNWFFAEPVKLFSGFELQRVPLLFVMSFSFLALVVINGQFKMYINTFKGRVGERILRRIRYELFDRVLRYPLSRFRRQKPSEIASMIKDEVEPMGDFIGDAFTQPLFLGGQALTGLTFIFLQNFYLGIVTLVVVLFQAWLIPTLRRQLITLSRERQVEARLLSGKIGEAVESIRDIHTNDYSNYQRATVSRLMGNLFFIRYDIYQRKFFIKFINNFLMQFLAFFFYSAGGYLAIRGTIDLGQLLGVIVAYKDLPDPIRALIDYDQSRLIVDARYNQIIEQFDSDDLQDEKMFNRKDQPVLPFQKGYEFSNLSVTDETGSKLIVEASLRIELGEKVAVIGRVNSGAREFGELLARLQQPSSGLALLDNKPLDELPEYICGRRISYVDANSFFAQNSIYNTLTEVLKHEPVRQKPLTGEEKHQHAIRLAEARLSGSTLYDPDADWIDYQALGFSGEQELRERIHQILQFVGLDDDIRVLALNSSFDPAERPQTAERLVEARHIFRQRLQSLGLENIVEPFTPDRYNHQATIAENLLFGTAMNAAFSPERLSSNPFIRNELAHSPQLHKLLFDIGHEIAATTVELFGELAADNAFFNNLHYMTPQEIPLYRALLKRTNAIPFDKIRPEDESMILRLSFAYVESTNRMNLLNDHVREHIVSARQNLRQLLEGLSLQPVSFYDPDSYNPAATVLDNILLGRVSREIANAQTRVNHVVDNLLDELGLADEIFNIGLDYNIGAGGKLLGETQRQKLTLSRGLVKAPDILVVNQALSALDGRSKNLFTEKLLTLGRQKHFEKLTVICVLMNAEIARLFDRVIVFEQGKIVGDGTPEYLAKNCKPYQHLTSLA